MTLLLVLVAIAVVGAVALLMVRDKPLLQDDPTSAPQLRWDPEVPDLAAALDRVRFTIAVRGYRMDQVDRVLDDLARALEQQQERITELEGHGATARGVDSGDDPVDPEREGPEEVAPERAPTRAGAAQEAQVVSDPQEPAAP